MALKSDLNLTCIYKIFAIGLVKISRRIEKLYKYFTICVVFDNTNEISEILLVCTRILLFWGRYQQCFNLFEIILSTSTVVMNTRKSIVPYRTTLMNLIDAYFLQKKKKLGAPRVRPRKRRVSINDRDPRLWLWTVFFFTYSYSYARGFPDEPWASVNPRPRGTFANVFRPFRRSRVFCSPENDSAHERWPRRNRRRRQCERRHRRHRISIQW